MRAAEKPKLKIHAANTSATPEVVLEIATRSRASVVTWLARELDGQLRDAPSKELSEGALVVRESSVR